MAGIILNVSMPFSSRGVHPFVSGVSMDFSPAQQTSMATVDGTSATVGFSGTTNAGVIEWKQAAPASLSLPVGEVLTIITVEVVARVASPVTYTTDPVWGVELYDSRNGALLAGGKQSTIPIAGTLQSCIAGGVDLWGMTSAKLLEVLSAQALRVRWTSPGWTTGSTGSLVIDGARLTVQSGPPPASKRQIIQTRRSAVSGRVPQPSELVEGELAINTAEGRLYAGRGDRTIGLNAVPFWWSTAQYQPGYVVMGGSTSAHANRLWVANKVTGPGARVDADWNEYHAYSAEWANHLAGLDINQLYNIIHPWWAPRLWRGSQADIVNENNALAAAGIAARWWIADGFDGRPNAVDRVVRGAGADNEINTLAGAWTGAVDLGGFFRLNQTGDTALTIGQMPSHNHNPDGNFVQLLRNNNSTASVKDDAIGNFGGINLRASGAIVPQGGGAAHSHTIADIPNHQHTYTLDIKRISWWYLVRTA